jgi:hypothetical protein
MWRDVLSKQVVNDLYQVVDKADYKLGLQLYTRFQCKLYRFVDLLRL